MCDFNFELPMNFLRFNFGLPMTFVGSTFIGCPTGRCAASSASPCLGSPSARTQMSAGNTPEIEIILKQNKIFYNKIKNNQVWYDFENLVVRNIIVQPTENVYIACKSRNGELRR